MRLYDGVNPRYLSDQQLQSEYDAIVEDRYDNFYKDKMAYLWFRSREVWMEMERRGSIVFPPPSFVGTDRGAFNYWTPSFEDQRESQNRVVEEMNSQHTRYGKPIPYSHKETVRPLF